VFIILLSTFCVSLVFQFRLCCGLTRVNVCFLTLPVGVWSIVISVSVCLYFCLFACLKNQTSRFSALVSFGHDSVLLSFCGWLIFSHNGAKMMCMFLVRQVAAPGRSLPSMTASCCVPWENWNQYEFFKIRDRKSLHVGLLLWRHFVDQSQKWKHTDFQGFVWFMT